MHVWKHGHGSKGLHRQGLQVDLHHQLQTEQERSTFCARWVQKCTFVLRPWLRSPRQLLQRRWRNCTTRFPTACGAISTTTANREAHYRSTGPEICKQIWKANTHFIVGVGTGGTISGTAKYLKEQNPDIQIWGIDSYGSVFKKYHETGEFDENEIYSYITEGIGEDILPANVDFSLIDHFEKVTDERVRTPPASWPKKKASLDTAAAVRSRGSVS